MNIIVCIKQVPDVDDIKWTKENNLDRTNMLSKINPYDEYALDVAINIKSKFKNVKITVISMGPNQAKEVLNYALAKGADRAILLSDKAFAGSDTLATSKILACAIQKYCSDFNLILTGQLAVDGDTQQVPLSLAQLLKIPEITNVNEFYNADKDMAIVSQKIGLTTNVFEIKTPCIIAVKENCAENYIPKIDDYIRAQNIQIEEYNLDNIDLAKDEVGIIGSPTMVYKAFRPEINKNTKEIKENIAKTILDFILKVDKK